MKGFLTTITAILAFLAAVPALGNPVEGPCANCHTMHNSQEGQPMDLDGAGPNKSLLKTDCLGCHSADDGGTWKDPVTGAPIVYNRAAPTYGAKYKDGPNQGLAGGNFYFVEHVDDNRGHNVMLGNPDDNLNWAPTNNLYACGAGSCHENLNEVYTGGSKPEYQGKQGCTKCHMYQTGTVTHLYPNSWHHIPQNPGASKERYGGKYYSAAQGGWVMNWYRHLAAPHTSNRQTGVTGCEDPDWEHTMSANDHNDYYEGGSFSMGFFCLGCHSAFCDNVEVYEKHPAINKVIPDADEFANAYGVNHTYDPLVPIGQPSILGSQAPKADVTLGSDRVTCLTCHRAHGSPYQDMLRFPYDDMQAGGGAGDGEGCFKCHTAKDGS